MRRVRVGTLAGAAARKHDRNGGSVPSPTRASDRKASLAATLAAFAASALASAAHAQSAAPGGGIALEPLVVDTDASKPAPTTKGSRKSKKPAGAAAAPAPAPAEPASAAAEQQSRERLQAIAGGTAIVTEKELEGKASRSIVDALDSVPGVIVQSFFGGNDQPKIHIRGSGLQTNPVERGLLFLKDGLPVNRADGSYIVALPDPRLTDFIEVFRGYTANRLGATVLGGAINFVSPNGVDAPGTVVTAEGGSFGYFNGAVSSSARQGDLDATAQASRTTRDGFREHNDSDRTALSLNGGVRINDNVRTRLFVDYTQLSFDIPGPLTKQELEADPTQIHAGPTFVPPSTLLNPGPNVVRDRPYREAEQFRVGSRTAASFGAHGFDVGASYINTDDTFTFPIANGVRVTDGYDVATLARYVYRPAPSAPLPLFEMNALYQTGTADRTYFHNKNGQKGALFGSNELEAQTLSLYAGANIPIARNMTLAASLAYSWADRDNEDTYGLASRPTLRNGGPPPNPATYPAAVPAVDTSFSRTYEGWTPSLSLQVRPDNHSMLFAAVSRSFEPPTFEDLLATTGGTPNSGPLGFTTNDLDAQTATTAEIGWRGSFNSFRWDAVAYYSWIEDELLSLRDQSGASLGTVNADKTTHAGIELGVAHHWTETIWTRVAYTYQDFRFDDDPVFGDNRLAGAARHNIDFQLQYDDPSGFTLAGVLHWRPGETPVDNANSLFQDSYAVVDLRGAYAVTAGTDVYLNVLNVFDVKYAASTLISDKAVADQAAFLPGDGRAFIVGTTNRF